MQNKKHSAASNMKTQRNESVVNNTEGAHMPDAKATGKVSEKDARAAFGSDKKSSSQKHK